jgi:multicomponent Na+:H+ antiporter subunit B
MKSIVLRSASRALTPIMLLFSLALLVRGHDEPGGGFAGGLVAAAAIILRGLAYEPAATRDLLLVDPKIWVATGLLLCLVSGVIGLLAGEALLQAQWWFRLETSEKFKISVGTPLLFDFGVYIGVIGAVVSMVTRLLRE